MQIIRTILWVLLIAGLLLFSVVNWDPTVTVRIWQGLVVDTKIPAIVVVSFLIGFIPMWLIYRASKWQLNRKIASLESAMRTAAATPVMSDDVLDGPASPPQFAPQETPAASPTLTAEADDAPTPTSRGALP